MATEVNLCETTLLLTRPEPAAQRFGAMVKSTLGDPGQIVISPLQQIVTLSPKDLPRRQEGLVFSSENGVMALVNKQPAEGRPTWCVGERTAECAQNSGFDVRGVCATAEDLGTRLIAEKPTLRLVHVAGRHRRGALVERLRDAGLAIRTLEAYDQQARPLTEEARRLLGGAKNIVAPVFSPRSAQLFADAAAMRRAPVHVVAISMATSAEWKPRPIEHVEIADTPDAAGVISAMGRLFDADRSA